MDTLGEVVGVIANTKSATGVLFIDDDQTILDLVSARSDGFGTTLTVAGSLAEARGHIERSPPALILLDINLPDGDGLTFCSSLRAEGYAGVILMLTARTAPNDRVDGFESGADDYLAKPFAFRELDARVRNWLRRVGSGHGKAPERFRFARFGAWRLDFFQRRLVAPDDSITMLSTSEFDLLKRLVEQPHTEIKREDLIPERRETVYIDRALDNRMSRLRQKLSTCATEPLIVTVRNRGFKLAADVQYERS